MARNLTILALFIGLITACTYTMKVRDGRTAVEVKQYAVAVDLLQKEYDKAKSRVEQGKIAFLLGESYQRLNKSDQSIRWYQIAYDNQFGVDALKEYAYALKRAERYEEAMRAFKDLGIEIGSPYEYRREISACQIALGWKALPPEYEVEVLSFNTGNADYSPVVYKDNQLVISSDRSASEGDDTYNWTGNAFSDLFLVDLKSNSVTGFDNNLNTENNEGTVAFNKDYSEVYFTRCYSNIKYEDAYCKLMASEGNGNSWSVPQPLPFIEEGVNYVHPSLSADGNTLYFSSDHPDGWGGYDIYFAERQGDGAWGLPQLLSRSVNTPGDEKFPFIDGDTLYFASDSHTGMGGLDIFRSYMLSNGSWAPAYNLKAPINSGGDDFGYVIDYNAPKPKGVLQVGYFTSTREDGIGGDDIYRFTKVIPPEPPVVEVPEEIEYKLILEGYVLEKIYNNPTDPNSKVLGRKPLPGSEVAIRFNKQKETVTVGEDGMFRLELEENTDYGFLASRENYLNNDAAFSTVGIGRDPNNPVQTFEIEIVLDKIFLDKEITLENIYYDFDKWDIRNDAKPTLDELTRNLKLNPDIRIQLGSHTDCRGTTRYNEDLSQKRAQSAVDYLIANGIDPSRLVARGYGESQPEVDCLCARCTEDEHQANRRTTFKIIE
ncbi:MAG: OmpA family protein [Lewinellaceae bacterium]|nr:OmpA family protein [Phaeodactylibacter sp.]MCB9035773.1 OmpA family protein [Lewinellaceae bacterium]